MATTLGCGEVEALADLLRAAGETAAAEVWIERHAEQDDAGDAHYRGITVYTSPGCVQCTMTTRALDARGLTYDVCDVSEDPFALAYVKQLGYSQAPVVTVEDQHWSGFQPDRIANIDA